MLGPALAPAAGGRYSLKHGSQGQSSGQLDGIVRTGQAGPCLCPQGMHVQLLWILSAGWKPRTSWLLGAGTEGEQQAQLTRFMSALHPGWQEPGKQTQPSLSLPFFGCFSNLHDSFSPRLIAQSQAARTTGHEPSCPTAMGIYPFYSLLRPLFALVWKGLDHPAGGSENMHCEGTGTGDSVKASVLRALPCSRGHREPAWDKKSGSKVETTHPRAA